MREAGRCSKGRKSEQAEEQKENVVGRGMHRYVDAVDL